MTVSSGGSEFCGGRGEVFGSAAPNAWVICAGFWTNQGDKIWSQLRIGKVAGDCILRQENRSGNM